MEMNILGIFHSFSDPSAALLVEGKVVSFMEEERLTRIKHSKSHFPILAIENVLKEGNIKITDIDFIVQAWDCNIYDSGEMKKIYAEINSKYGASRSDLSYQENYLNTFKSENQKNIIIKNLKKKYGDIDFPPILFMNHHQSHACMGFFQSGFEESLVLVIDGSGEHTTTSWWIGKDKKLELLHKVNIPHSLGWFYSAFTEYLGFEAYDGEYKVMGLAAYGEENLEIQEKLSKIIWYDGKGGFESNPLLLSMGERSFSYYFPDSLIELMGKNPRTKNEEISKWHKDLAYEIQKKLEEISEEMLKYWVDKTNIHKLVVAGGVGLNVKMNGRFFKSEDLTDLFTHPLCSDSGISIGALLAYQYNSGDLEKTTLKEIYYGPSYNEDIEDILKLCKLKYTKEDYIEKTVAKLVSDGKVVGWFQGKMEAGPRALGNRSILADPRNIESRDKVNSVIKYREFWRPFCPSMTIKGAEKYINSSILAPFMITTFDVNQEAKKEIPAVVHVDGTTRPQIVEAESNPKFHNLIEEFEKLTNVPCILNTSFNIKGEPIVCTPQDAIRTFSATGLDALAIGPYLLTKENML
jgi:carbamoyltransferase